MSRKGLKIALGLAAFVGVLFAVFPQLDLWIASLFFQSDYRPDLSFGQRVNPTVIFFRDRALWISAILVAIPAIALVGKLIAPHRRMFMPGRAAVLLVVTMALGPGLLTNLVLKDYWSRPRPIDVTQFGGNERFVPWWDPRGDCDKNCSFVSGDVSGSFWTFAPAALAPAPLRPVAYGAVILFGSAVGVMRMMAGGHFFTDVFFAGVLTFLVVWVVYGFLYRWSGWSDDDIEQAVGTAATSSAAKASRFSAAAWAGITGPLVPVRDALRERWRLLSRLFADYVRYGMAALRRLARLVQVKVLLLVDPNAVIRRDADRDPGA